MKRLIAVLFALIAISTLSGCVAMTGTTTTDAKTLNKADLVFIGLPAPLSWFTAGIQGTVFPVQSNTSLTAAHVAGPLLKTIKARHQTCDVAAIARDNTDAVKHHLAYARMGRTVTAYGYSAISGLPKSGTGKITGWITHDGCRIGVITGGGAVSGMSGGPVVDDATGDTIGVLYAGQIGRGIVYFVPVQSFTNVLDRLHIPYKKY